jgi:hypothetical protein
MFLNNSASHKPSLACNIPYFSLKLSTVFIFSMTFVLMLDHFYIFDDFCTDARPFSFFDDFSTNAMDYVVYLPCAVDYLEA